MFGLVSDLGKDIHNTLLFIVERVLCVVLSLLGIVILKKSLIDGKLRAIWRRKRILLIHCCLHVMTFKFGKLSIIRGVEEEIQTDYLQNITKYFEIALNGDSGVSETMLICCSHIVEAIFTLARGCLVYF